jgi:hypothetical protein
MEQSPSRETNSHSASQEIPRLLLNPKVHYHVHKSSPLVRLLSQMNPILTFPLSFPPYSNITSHLHLDRVVFYSMQLPPHACYVSHPPHPPWFDHPNNLQSLYEGVSKSYRTGLLERELQMVQLSATRCRCIAILWVSLVSFAAITLCVASQRCVLLLFISLSTQSGNFWIHPRIYINI